MANVHVTQVKYSITVKHERRCMVHVTQVKYSMTLNIKQCEWFMLNIPVAVKLEKEQAGKITVQAVFNKLESLECL